MSVRLRTQLLVPTVHFMETAAPLGSGLPAFSELINHLLARVVPEAGTPANVRAPSMGQEVEKETGTRPCPSSGGTW